MPLEPFGDFLAAVAHLAERDAGADGRAARDYLDAFSKRRQIVAQTIGKYELLGELAPRDQGCRRRARVHRDGARREPRDQPSRSAGVDRSHHRFDRPPPTARDPRRPARAPPRRGRRAPSARRRHRRSRREPRHRHEREPYPAPDDPAHGPHPAAQAPGGCGTLRDHVRQGHVGGPRQPRRTRRLPRRDRAHLRGDRGVRRRPASTSSTRSSRRRAPMSCPTPSISRVTSAPRSPRVADSDSVTGRRTGRRARPRRSASRPRTRSSRFAHDADGRKSAATPRSDRSSPRLPAPKANAPPYLELELANLPMIAKPRVEPKRLSTGAGAARDRTHRYGVAHQLHRMRRGVTARRVPLAGARPNRRLPL